MLSSGRIQYLVSFRMANRVALPAPAGAFYLRGTGLRCKSSIDAGAGLSARARRQLMLPYSKNVPVPGSRMVDRVPVRNIVQDWPARTVRYISQSWRGPVVIRAPGVVFNMRYVGLHEHQGRGLYPLHTHPHSEFLLTLSGRGELHLPERQVVLPCAPGYLAVLPPRTVHQSVWALAAQARWRMLIVDFDLAVDSGQLLIEAGEKVDLAFAPFHEFFFVRGHPGVPLNAEVFSAVKTIMEEIIHSLTAPRYGVCSEVVAGLIRVVALFSRQLRETGLADGAHVAPPLCSKEAALLKARSLMECDGDLDAGCVARIARSVGMSASHFSREFKQMFARAPKQYSLEVRMRRAAALLGRSDVSVKDAAYQLGYADAASFTRAFSRYHGRPPRAAARNASIPAKNAKRSPSHKTKPSVG